MKKGVEYIQGEIPCLEVPSNLYLVIEYKLKI
nr:MAG TPA: hypothetical protein [Caudoviricetes sp.]